MERIKWIGIVCFALCSSFIGWDLLGQDCTPPVIFTSQATTDTSVHLFWLSFENPENGFEVTVVPDGLGPDSGTVIRALPGERTMQISGLDPNTSYRGFIRSLCLLDTSRWTNHPFLTDIRNQYDCLTYRPIPDGGCGNNSLSVTIHVPPSDSGQLGENVTLSAVNVIIDHPYPADLKLELSNPRGVTIPLIVHHGTLSDHFGKPGDSTCIDRTRWTDKACGSIYDAPPPFIGSFQPDMPLRNLEDGGSPAGEWILKVCDRALDDVGVLEHISLEFDYSSCPIPPVPELMGHADESVQFYQAPTGADTCLLAYHEGIGVPQNPRDTNFQWMLLSSEDTLHSVSNLQLGSSYEYYTYVYCDGEWIGPSCPGQFTTFCGMITSYENWSANNPCEANCNDNCLITSELWQTPSSSAPWSARQGTGSFSFTGPNNALFPNSDGAYLVSSGQQLQCDARFHQLRSVCLTIDSSACGLGFYYHMNGAQLGSLRLLLSADEWISADTLFVASSSQGPNWQYAYIDQVSFPDAPFQLEFQVVNPIGPFSEIAIGDVFFSGFAPIPLAEQLNYVDEDKDGFGDPNRSVLYCGSNLPDSIVSQAGDCNDQDSLINPGMADILCSGVDENCDGIENVGPGGLLSVELLRSRSPSCPEKKDGQLEITIQGGTAPYEIQWSTGDSSLVLDSLTAGLYSLTVTDSAACQQLQREFELLPTYDLNFSFSILAQPSCLEPNGGSVQVFTAGGNPPYQYEWSNGVIGPQNDSLQAGSFQVTVIDNNQCVFISPSVHLSANDVFDLSIHPLQSISCPDSLDGELIALSQGATGPLAFEWNTGDTTQSINSVGEGWYQVQAMDSNSCVVVSDSVLIADPEPLRLSDIIVRPQRCVGQSDGEIQIEVSGGTPPYRYDWNLPSGENSKEKNLYQINAGTYDLTLSDSKGCIQPVDPIIVDSALGFVLLDAFVEESNCPFSPDGQIDIAISEALDPLSIQWSDGASNQLNRSDLLPGFYQLTITNSLECKRSLGPFEIPAGNDPLDVQVSSSDTLVCGSPQGIQIEGVIQQGKKPFLFHWSNGRQLLRSGMEDSLEVLQPGRYNLTVTDHYGCVGLSDSLLVLGRSPITLDSINTIDPGCPDYQNGKIELWASTDAPPVRYFWSSGERSAIIEGLMAGSYEVTMEDETGCLPLIKRFELSGPTPFEIFLDTLTQAEEVCVFYTIEGGIPPYEISINGNIITENPICFSQNEERVELLFQDASNCDQNYLVWERPSATTEGWGQPSDLKLFPNPTEDRLNGMKDVQQSIQFQLYHITGQKLDEGYWINKTNTFDLSEYPPGLYIFKFTFPSGNTVYREILKQ